MTIRRRSKMTPDQNGDETVSVRRMCKVCGEPFDTWGSIFPGMVDAKNMPRVVCIINVCERCTGAQKAKVAQGNAIARDASRLKLFDALCDPYYRSEAIRAAMPIDKAKEVREHVQSGRGVLCVGETGKFKTTCVWNGAIRYLVMRGVPVECLTAAQFRQRTSRASKETTVEAFIDKLASAPWLFLDDVGNASVGEGATEALLALTEARLARGMAPVLITTQYAPDALETRFTRPEAGKAIVRRLRLLTSTVTFP